MSKVIVYQKFAADTYPVLAATVTTGWLPGQCFTVGTGGFAAIASTDTTMFVAIDDDLELAAPPTGSLLTGIYGSGTKFIIDHTEEVDAGSATRAYATAVGNPEAGALAGNLYINATGSWTTTATGSVKGKIWQVPETANHFGLGVITRF